MMANYNRIIVEKFQNIFQAKTSIKTSLQGEIYKSSASFPRDWWFPEREGENCPESHQWRPHAHISLCVLFHRPIRGQWIDNPKSKFTSNHYNRRSRWYLLVDGEHSLLGRHFSHSPVITIFTHHLMDNVINCSMDQISFAVFICDFTNFHLRIPFLLSQSGWKGHYWQTFCHKLLLRVVLSETKKLLDNRIQEPEIRLFLYMKFVILSLEI